MEKVVLKTKNLSSLFGLEIDGQLIDKNETFYNLAIPDYQRIYCWEERNVITLLDDILNYSHNKYHLGNIILHLHRKENANHYNIVDGQQRLVTLALLLQKLDSNLDFIFLQQVFDSEEAREYIAYNKYLIRNYIDNNEELKGNVLRILNNIQFSVLIIEEGSLDLAYTFFSNQNSRGVPLSDYALLKAHHLRFIHIQEQAEHLAKRWDSVVLASENDDNSDNLNKTFDKYLFRLRKWMRKREWGNDEKYRVKVEFEAASIIKEIPPFGEQFYYNETIQGGSHFFAYADHFIFKFHIFSQTKEYQLLQKYLSYDNHWWYREIVEAFLFAYYVKFGEVYLEDALKGILFLLSDHRYHTGRAYLPSLLKFAGETEIAMMIDQSTSPTFFLAELQKKCKFLPKYNELSGTRARYQNAVIQITLDRKPTVTF